MVSKQEERMQIAINGEKNAIKILTEFGYKVTNIKGHLSVDITAEKDGIQYGINVKSGKSYHVTNKNLTDMIKNQELFGISSLFFLNNNGCYLFTLNKIFPSVNDFISKPLPDIEEKFYHINSNKQISNKQVANKQKKKRIHITMIDPDNKVTKSFTVLDITVAEAIDRIKKMFSEETPSNIAVSKKNI